MLKSRLVREHDAQLYFELMAYLIRQFGAPLRPSVPKLLRKTPGLEAQAWESSDTRSIFHWAQDYFGEIKSHCQMRGLGADLFAQGADVNAEQILTNHRLDTLAAGRIPYPESGALSVTYDPWKCATPGYYVATISLQIAQFRLASFRPETELSASRQQKMVLMATAYNRQGFVLANLPEHVSDSLEDISQKRAMSQTHILNSLCFATCLALRVRGQSAEQIIATYGTRMNKNFRKKIPQACRQIDARAEELEVLQLLAEPKTRKNSDWTTLERSA